MATHSAKPFSAGERRTLTSAATCGFCTYRDNVMPSIFDMTLKSLPPMEKNGRTNPRVMIKDEYRSSNGAHAQGYGPPLAEKGEDERIYSYVMRRIDPASRSSVARFPMNGEALIIGALQCPRHAPETMGIVRAAWKQACGRSLHRVPRKPGHMHGWKKLRRVRNPEEKVRAATLVGRKAQGDGRTMLHLVAIQGWFELCKYLVDQCDAQLEVADAAGYTPVMYALMYSHDQVAHLLSDRSQLRLDVARIKKYRKTSGTSTSVAKPRSPRVVHWLNRSPRRRLSSRPINPHGPQTAETLESRLSSELFTNAALAFGCEQLGSSHESTKSSWIATMLTCYVWMIAGLVLRNSNPLSSGSGADLSSLTHTTHTTATSNTFPVPPPAPTFVTGFPARLQALAKLTRGHARYESNS